MDKRRILILAGTTEARHLAERLVERADMSPILSLAGRTRDPLPLPAPTRIGGFGGAEGLARFLSDEAIDLLIDATHPFAARMARNAFLAARSLGLPMIKLERPAWQPGAGDRWTMVASIEEAIRALGSAPRRVFLATGRQGTEAVTLAPQHHYLVRSVDPIDPPLPVPHLRTILARGPFDLEAERALLIGERIDAIVCKNSGGGATDAKLTAGRDLGLEVVMVERPHREAVRVAASVEEALAMIDHGASLPAKRGV